MSDLTDFVDRQVLPALPAKARHTDPAFWVRYCREVGLDFERFKQHLADAANWSHGDPDAISHAIGSLKVARKALCDRVIAKARNDAS